MQIAHMIGARAGNIARCLVLAVALASLGCRTGHARSEDEGPLRTTIEVRENSTT